MSRRRTYPLMILAFLTVAGRLPPAFAQEQKYRERQVLDPQTDRWVDAAPVPEGVPEDPLDRARALLAQSKPTEARRILRKWVKENPDDERYYEGVYLLGESYYQSRDFWKAVQQYQNVAENASGELFQLAQARCLDVGRAFLAGQKRILWGIFRLPAWDDGVEILDRVWQREPGSRIGELALKYKGDFRFARGDMDLAQDEYAGLVEQYPSGRYVQYAMLRTAEAAEAAFPGIKFDDRPLLEADQSYRQFQNTFPGYAERERIGARLEGIRQQRAEKDLDIARWYERTRRPDAAQYYYRRILRDWPGTLAEAEARSRLRALGVHLEDAEAPGTGQPGVAPPQEVAP
jgi:tetratricopeptide (TPR) repeat protein